MKTTQLFYDSEFTGLSADSSLISIGLITPEGRGFYAEFTDYNAAQCDDWIRENVLHHCRWLSQVDLPAPFVRQQGEVTHVLGGRLQVRDALTEWLKQFEKAEVWADCLAYDWVLLCELFGGALHLPSQLFYMPMDLATLFKIKGIDPDCDRLVFSELEQVQQHNALDDARMARACYNKLIVLPDRSGDQQYGYQ